MSAQWWEIPVGLAIGLPMFIVGFHLLEPSIAKWLDEWLENHPEKGDKGTTVDPRLIWIQGAAAEDVIEAARSVAEREQMSHLLLRSPRMCNSGLAPGGCWRSSPGTTRCV